MNSVMISPLIGLQIELFSLQSQVCHEVAASHPTEAFFVKQISANVFYSVLVTASVLYETALASYLQEPSLFKPLFNRHYFIISIFPLICDHNSNPVCSNFCTSKFTVKNFLFFLIVSWTEISTGHMFV